MGGEWGIHLWLRVEEQSSFKCDVFVQGPTWDGRSGIHTHMTNTRITDPEIVERRYHLSWDYL